VWHLNLSLLQLLGDAYNALANVFALNDFIFSGVISHEVSNRQYRWLREKTKKLLLLQRIDERLHGGVDG
jgi:hypothetical protein